jgi:predicted transcriptional regulator
MIKVTKEELEFMLSQNSQRQIGELLGCTQSNIFKLCKKYGIKKVKRHAHNFIDLTGQTIHSLFVESITDKVDKTGKIRYWNCLCLKCGQKKVINGKHLNGKKIKSCGCRLKEMIKYHGYEEISGKYWQRLQGTASKAGRLFDITIEYAWNLYIAQHKQCALSGLDIHFTSYNSNNRYKQTASLDRIDSKLGYIAGNVQWVHKHINMMKQAYTQSLFIEYCIRVADHAKAGS